MFDFLKKKESASIAKDRLTIAIMSDRGQGFNYPFMDELKQEIIAVVRKYIEVRNIDITKEISGDFEALSIDVELNRHLG